MGPALIAISGPINPGRPKSNHICLCRDRATGRDRLVQDEEQTSVRRVRRLGLLTRQAIRRVHYGSWTLGEPPHVIVDEREVTQLACATRLPWMVAAPQTALLPFVSLTAAPWPVAGSKAAFVA
jgi:hypothetical protein